MLKKKIVFISNLAAPYQVKFCYALQEYFDAEFWFYEHIGETRPTWWKIPLGDKCKIMKCSGRLPMIGYFSFGLFFDLIRFKPDVILLGGFMKWHYLIFKLAKLFNKKVVFLSEPLRYVKNDSDQSNDLRTKENSKKELTVLNRFFRGADLYLGMGQVAQKQFIEEIGFDKEKVNWTSYPQDLDEYYAHPLRVKNKSDVFRILFANRLIERYQPLFVIEVFEKIFEKYPNTELLMNSDGPLQLECAAYIEKKKIKNVKFLDKIDSWGNMHLVYKHSDILILPATYSNGNGTIYEARASGMGVVISNKINHIDYHSINNVNCFICELKLEDFVESIIKYIENPELFVSHGEISRKLVEKRKNENTAKQYYDLFQKYGML
ncbi:Glycosyltransferase involved in cell wall bisynthesis [Psychrobacillus sp. OK028]|uniref:glycosyltransferase n=1 Tax=Psychrobacillus sp. OK028 TaxID=1884359 RepID=UPI00088CDAC4|nr:glycosyltransferase [Psychrobacillus sp. OK028]SDO00722.1 Glycosyltransferase involved in cell wall bisynthesis [Psychrobacillus sp. OK028]